MDHLIVIALTLAAGLALRRPLGSRAAETSAALNAYAVHVALPALILASIPRLELTTSAALLVITPWLTLAASALVILAVSRRHSWSRAVTGALLLVAPLGNTSFLGLPLTRAWLGDEALPLAIVHDQLGSFLALTLYGSFIVARFAPRPEQPAAARPLVTRVLTFPPFLALLIGLALAIADLRWPAALDLALDAIGQSLVPTIMVALGLSWQLGLEREHRAPLALALTLKLALAPALAAVLAALTLGLGDRVGHVMILESAMGPMITAGALATTAGLAPRLVASVIGLGTLLSLVTTSALGLLLA